MTTFSQKACPRCGTLGYDGATCRNDRCSIHRLKSPYQERAEKKAAEEARRKRGKPAPPAKKKGGGFIPVAIVIMVLIMIFAGGDDEEAEAVATPTTTAPAPQQAQAPAAQTRTLISGICLSYNYPATGPAPDYQVNIRFGHFREQVGIIAGQYSIIWTAVESANNPPQLWITAQDGRSWGRIYPKILSVEKDKDPGTVACGSAYPIYDIPVSGDIREMPADQR